MSTTGMAGSGSARAAGAASESHSAGADFGVAAVFWTTLSTILGAILFLRMGYAVGNLAFVVGVSDVEIERDKPVEESQEAPREAVRADAGESASEDHAPKTATGSAGA